MQGRVPRRESPGAEAGPAKKLRSVRPENRSRSASGQDVVHHLLHTRNAPHCSPFLEVRRGWCPVGTRGRGNIVTQGNRLTWSSVAPTSNWEGSSAHYDES